MSLEGFVVTAETTGGDVLARVSAPEVSCVRDEVGDAGYDTLAGTVLLEDGADPAFAAPMAACLIEDNFVVYTTAIIATNAGAHADESRACFTALGRANPGLAYISFGVGADYLASFDPESLRPFVDDFYACFTPDEKVRFTVAVMDHMAAVAPLSGEDIIDAMSDDVIECYLDGLGVSRAQFEAIIELAFAAGTATSTEGPDCVTQEALLNMSLAVFSAAIAGLDDESAACIPRVLPRESRHDGPHGCGELRHGGDDRRRLRRARLAGRRSVQLPRHHRTRRRASPHHRTRHRQSAAGLSR